MSLLISTVADGSRNNVAPVVDEPGSYPAALSMAVLAAVVAVPVLSGLVVGVLGIPISAAPWRGMIAQAASQAKKRN